MKKMLSALMLICPASFAMQSTAVKAPLTKENAVLVHQTRLFPKNGVMIPGSFQSFPDSASLTLKHCYEQAAQTITAIRPTLHWSLNSLVYPHLSMIDGKKRMLNRTDCPYIIIEPVTAFEGKKLQGYWQDVFHVGAHRLSKHSIILVPEHDTAHKEFIGDSRATIVEYNVEKRRETVEELLRKKGFEILYPSMANQENADEEIFHTDGIEQDVILNNATYSSHEIANCLELDNKVYATTGLKKVQNLFQKLELSCVRNACMCMFVARFYNPGLDLMTDRCFSCKENSGKSRCTKCHIACYCSRDCQKADWKTDHKEQCKSLEDLYNELKQLVTIYVKVLLKTKNPKILKELLSDITTPLEELLAHYSEKRERHLLRYYKQYIVRFIKAMFSHKQLDRKLRESHNYETIHGFLTFSHELLAELDTIATYFENDNN